MTQRAADNVEFVRINGEAVRVTSWTELDAATFRLVAIVRGSGDARALSELLASPAVELEVPGHPIQTMKVVNVDTRQAGEPPAIITRISADFEPGGDIEAIPVQSLEDRVAQLEQDLAQLRQIVQSLANRG